MAQQEPSSDDLKRRLANAEEVVEALREGEVDAVVGQQGVALLRLAETEKKLRRAQARVQLALGASGGGVYEYNIPLDDSTYYDERWTAILGYDPDEPPADTRFLDWFFAQVHDQDRPGLDRAYRDFVEGRTERYDGEFRLRHKDGHWVWARGIAQAPQRDEDGRARHVVGALFDISERKRREEELRESRAAALNLMQDAVRAEAARRDSETRARRKLAEIEAIYNSAPVGLCVYDRDLHYLRINQRLADINGVPREDHIGKTVRELVPGLADAAEELAEQIFQTGQPILNVELCGTLPGWPDEQRHWVEHWLPLKGADGSVEAINVVVEDVTERRRAEAERERLVQETERQAELLEGIMDHTSVGLAVLDGAGLIVKWHNPAYAEVLDPALEGADLTGRRFDDLVPQAVESGAADILRRVAATGQRHIEREWEHPGFERGRTYWRVAVVPLPGTGQPPDLLIIAEDLTDQVEARKRIEGLADELDLRVHVRTAQLHQANELLETMFENAHILVAYLDPDFNFLRVNRAYAQADGREPSFFVGRNHFDLYPHPENEAIFHRVVATREPYHVHARAFQRPGDADGKTTYWDWSLNPVTDPDGTVTGLILTLLDVTERERLERQILEVTEAEQRRIGRELHDGVAQQMTALAWIAEAVASGLKDRAAPESDQARRLDELAGRIVKEVRRLSHGLAPVRMGCGGLLDALEGLANEMTAGGKTHCACEWEDPAANYEEGAAIHLYRIAQEAVSNAIRHGEAGTIRIRLAESDSHLELIVEDDGTGIPDRHERPEGLGLHTMMYRARALGGSLAARRRPTGGTEVRCTIPIPPAPEKEEPDAELPG
jgi:PAS domain S-box-containing protein